MVREKVTEGKMEKTAEVYPLIMEPSFRCGQSTPWGGHALKEKYGKEAPGLSATR